MLRFIFCTAVKCKLQIFNYVWKKKVIHLFFVSSFQKFYRYYEHIYNKNLEQKKKSRVVAIPYFLVFKQCFSQCLNIFLIYFTTLIIFPVVLAGKYDMVTFQKIAIHIVFSLFPDVQKIEDDSIISSKYFTAVVCFLTFNLSSVLGNFLCSILIRIIPRRWQQICVSDLSTCFLYP